MSASVATLSSAIEDAFGFVVRLMSIPSKVQNLLSLVYSTARDIQSHLHRSRLRPHRVTEDMCNFCKLDELMSSRSCIV